MKGKWAEHLEQIKIRETNEGVQVDIALSLAGLHMNGYILSYETEVTAEHNHIIRIVLAKDKVGHIQKSRELYACTRLFEFIRFDGFNVSYHEMEGDISRYSWLTAYEDEAYWITAEFTYAEKPPVNEPELGALWLEPDFSVADKDDCNTDVVFTLGDGTKWVATFFTYSNIETLRQKNRKTGECLGGLYFCATDMILIERIEEDIIRQVLKDIIANGSYTTYCTEIT